MTEWLVKLYIKDGYIKITKPTWYSKSNIYEYIKKNRDDILKMYNENLEKTYQDLLSGTINSSLFAK